MTLSYEYFDRLVARQCSIIWHRISKSYPEARSPLKRLEFGIGLIQFYYGAKDDFGTRITDGFRIAYDLGMPLAAVLQELIIDFQRQAIEKARPKVHTHKVVPKNIGGIPIPLTVAHVEEFEDGKLVSRRYKDANGGIRIESDTTVQLVSYYQQKALDTPSIRTVFKFLVSAFCAESLIDKLEREAQDTTTTTPAVEKTSKKIGSYQPMKWNGTQKSLGELFVELKRNGWIDEFNFAAIQAAFTPSETIGQVMRPNNNFRAIYTPLYKPSFDKIKRFVAKKPVKALKKP